MIIIFNGDTIDLEGTNAYGIIKAILMPSAFDKIEIIKMNENFEMVLEEYLNDMFAGEDLYDGKELSICILNLEKQTLEKRIYQVDFKEIFHEVRKTELTFNLKDGV